MKKKEKGREREEKIRKWEEKDRNGSKITKKSIILEYNLA